MSEFAEVTPPVEPPKTFSVELSEAELLQLVVQTGTEFVGSPSPSIHAKLSAALPPAQ